MIRSAKQIFASLCAALPLAACAGIPVRGNVAGQPVDTRVDNEVARYYVAAYLAGQRSDAALDSRIADVYKNSPWDLPDRAELKRLSDEFSLDFAAAYFAERIAGAPENQGFRERYREFRTAFAGNRLRLPPAAANYEVMFVPTFLYKRLPIIGSDLAVPKRAMQKIGLPVHFVETVEDGAVERNAETVAAAIAARLSSGRRLILISASKSGPEVALALTRLGADGARHVAAWINAVGALQGSPLADERVLTGVENLVGQVDPAGIESLTTERSRRRFQSLRVPAHVLVVNYFGIPLSGDLSSWGRRGFGALSKYGPSDGILLLADMVFPGGLTVAEVGLDHYLLDRNLDAVTAGLVAAVINRSGGAAPITLPVADR